MNAEKTDNIQIRKEIYVSLCELCGSAREKAFAANLHEFTRMEVKAVNTELKG